MRHVTDDERRARIARRHGIAPGLRAADAESATRAMTVLHATEPATVYLSLAARVDGLSRADVDRVLYDERTLVKQLAMRRTLFVFPLDLLPAAWGSASARVAGIERKRIAKDIVLAGLADDGDAWLDDARVRVLRHLDDLPDGAQAGEVRALFPELATAITVSPGSQWNHTRVLTHLGATADIVRAVNTGHWRISRPRYTRMEHWLAEVPEAWGEREGYAELTARWLRSFGPGTTDDLAWWLGSTKTAVSAALADLDAVPAVLDDGRSAWLLPDDLEVEQPVAPWAALLPVLDPTVMGWKERGFYLGDLGSRLFDRNGNAGNTAWWDGRIVGSWVQDDAGRVHLHLLREVPPEGLAALELEADRLETWLDGERVGTVYPSPAMQSARADLS
ncbi:MAG: winged helix DNA-binding domain-containing protein [Actinobacteria bacterium]|uniref:Unannotated protein n=1 Tax=freshwater metagenome TaxID=449393 RepID=A0A6J6P194_9ZZZZ|nr:winged helix DNA-binding domain-containing protein [Actinomycetota bacterium]